MGYLIDYSAVWTRGIRGSEPCALLLHSFSVPAPISYLVTCLHTDPATGNEPVSVIMVAFNEAETIEAEVLSFYRAIVERLPGSEFIVAEDGSRDRTPEILRFP